MTDSDDFFAEYFDRANILIMDLDRPEEALPFLHRALAIQPQDSEALTLTALAYLGCASNNLRRYRFMDTGRDLLRVVRYYRAAIRANPDSDLAHTLRSWGFTLFGARRRALQAAQEALRYDPESPRLLQTQAETLLACRRYAEAEQAALTAREIDPEDVDFHLLLAQIARAQKRWQEAEAHCMDALALEAVHTKTLHCLGEILWAQNRKQEAIERFYEALKLEPESLTYRTTHSWAVRRYLLPGWAGKGFARLLTILILLWTAFLYAAVRSLGLHSWLAAPLVWFWGCTIGVFSYPHYYFPSYRRRLAEEHPPAIALAIQPEGGEVSLPDEPNILVFIAWNSLLLALLSLYGNPLIHLWMRLAESVGRAPVWLFILLSAILWQRFTPPSTTKEKPEDMEAEASDEERALEETSS